LAGLADSEPPAEPSSAVAAAESAEPQAAPEAEAVAAKEPQAEDRIVCKSQAITGSRFAKKSCMRESEWAAMTKKAEEDFATIRNRPVSCPDCRD
jgi:hypothetical protein